MLGIIFFAALLSFSESSIDSKNLCYLLNCKASTTCTIKELTCQQEHCPKMAFCAKDLVERTLGISDCEMVRCSQGYTCVTSLEHCILGMCTLASCVPDNEANSIWTKLRRCRRDAFHRRCNSFTSGNSFRRGIAAKTTEEWKFQKQMEYYLPCMVNNRKQVINLHVSDDEECENVGVEIEDIASAIADGDGETQNYNINLGNVTYRNGNNTKSDKDMSASAVKEMILKQSHKKIAEPGMRSITEHESRARETATEHQKLHDPTLPGDSLYHFFISMYRATQKLPPATQRIVKSKIFEAVDRAEATQLKTPGSLFQKQSKQFPSSSSASASSPLSHSNSRADGAQSVKSENHKRLVHHRNSFPEGFIQL